MPVSGSVTFTTVNDETESKADTVLIVRTYCEVPSSAIQCEDDDGNDWRSTVTVENIEANALLTFIVQRTEYSL